MSVSSVAYTYPCPSLGSEVLKTATAVVNPIAVSGTLTVEKIRDAYQALNGKYQGIQSNLFDALDKILPGFSSKKSAEHLVNFNEIAETYRLFNAEAECKEGAKAYKYYLKEIVSNLNQLTQAINEANRAIEALCAADITSDQAHGLITKLEIYDKQAQKAVEAFASYGVCKTITTQRYTFASNYTDNCKFTGSSTYEQVETAYKDLTQPIVSVIGNSVTNLEDLRKLKVANNKCNVTRAVYTIYYTGVEKDEEGKDKIIYGDRYDSNAKVSVQSEDKDIIYEDTTFLALFDELTLLDKVKYIKLYYTKSTEENKKIRDAFELKIKTLKTDAEELKNNANTLEKCSENISGLQSLSDFAWDNIETITDLKSLREILSAYQSNISEYVNMFGEIKASLDTAVQHGQDEGVVIEENVTQTIREGNEIYEAVNPLYYNLITNFLNKWNNKIKEPFKSFGISYFYDSLPKSDKTELKKDLTELKPKIVALEKQIEWGIKTLREYKEETQSSFSNAESEIISDIAYSHFNKHILIYVDTLDEFEKYWEVDFIGGLKNRNPGFTETLDSLLTKLDDLNKLKDQLANTSLNSNKKNEIEEQIKALREEIEELESGLISSSEFTFPDTKRQSFKKLNQVRVLESLSGMIDELTVYEGQIIDVFNKLKSEQIDADEFRTQFKNIESLKTQLITKFNSKLENLLNDSDFHSDYITSNTALDINSSINQFQTFEDNLLNKYILESLFTLFNEPQIENQIEILKSQIKDFEILGENKIKTFEAQLLYLNAELKALEVQLSAPTPDEQKIENLKTEILTTRRILIDQIEPLEDQMTRLKNLDLGSVKDTIDSIKNTFEKTVEALEESNKTSSITGNITDKSTVYVHERYVFPEDSKCGFPCIKRETNAGGPNNDPNYYVDDVNEVCCLELFYVGYLVNRDGAANALASFMEIKTSAILQQIKLLSYRVKALQYYLKLLNRGFQYLNQAQNDDWGSNMDRARWILQYVGSNTLHTLYQDNGQDEILVQKDSGTSGTANYTNNEFYAIPATDEGIESFAAGGRTCVAVNPPPKALDTQLMAIDSILSVQGKDYNGSESEYHTDFFNMWAKTYDTAIKNLESSLEYVNKSIESLRTKVNTFDGSASSFRTKAYSIYNKLVNLIQ